MYVLVGILPMSENYQCKCSSSIRHLQIIYSVTWEGGYRFGNVSKFTIFSCSKLWKS